MTRRYAIAILFIVFGVLAAGRPIAGANADPAVDVDSAQNGIAVDVRDDFHYDGLPVEPVASLPGPAMPSLSGVLDALCIGGLIGATEGADCGPEEPGGQLTIDMVASAFARIPLPPSELIVQPPNGRTLVNFDTNFYTEAEPFARTVTLLGQRVDLNITPASFGWRFGDGETTSTTSPGSAYPDLEITHSYLRKGRVSPSVDTTYTATFRVNGGPWQPVPGSVTILGPTVALQVVTARPQLVG